jgi:hypothetical protein
LFPVLQFSDFQDADGEAWKSTLHQNYLLASSGHERAHVDGVEIVDLYCEAQGLEFAHSVSAVSPEPGWFGEKVQRIVLVFPKGDKTLGTSDRKKGLGGKLAGASPSGGTFCFYDRIRLVVNRKRNRGKQGPASCDRLAHYTSNSAASCI